MLYRKESISEDQKRYNGLEPLLIQTNNNTHNHKDTNNKDNNNQHNNNDNNKTEIQLPDLFSMVPFLRRHPP